MARDSSFRKDATYREISDRDLYYDLEYTISKPELQMKKTSSSVILYLFFVSLIMTFFFNIPQVLTILSIIIYGAAQQYFKRIFGINQKIIGLVLIFVANIIDHLIAGLVIQPGQFITEDLNIWAWGLEVLWIIFLGVEFLSSFAPETSQLGKNTVKPATEESIHIFNNLKRRVTGTDYEFSNFEEEIDSSLLQETFRSLVRYLILGFIFIVVFDALLWEVVSILSGGNNIQEAYFVSGISFIIYSAIILSSANLFPSDNSRNKSRGSGELR